MIVNRRMHCTVDREPNSYHRLTTPGTSVHAVNLGFECVSDLADDDPHLADDESSGKADFAQFLAAIASLDFHLYAIQPDNTATLVTQATAWAQPFTGQPADVMAWLDDQPRGRRFWTEAVQGADVAIEIAHNQAGATHLLRGAQAWSAPVAHHFGLTRLIGVGQDLTMPHIVLPATAGTTPADSIAVTLLTVPGESSPLWEAEMGHGLVCRASQLQANVASSALLDADGYLPVRADAEQTRRVLDGFERRWAGLMFALPSLLAPGAAGKAADNEALGDLLAPLWVYEPASSTQTTPESWRLHAPEAAWRIATGLIAALDPIIVALLRPAGSTPTGSGAEGDILAALISHLMDECESQPSVPALSAAQWRDLLREMLRQSPLLGGVGAAVDHLVRVHGLAPLTATSPASVHLLNLLLRIAGGDAVVLERAQIEAVAATITGTDAEGFRPDAYAEVTAAACRLQEEGGCETAIIALFAAAAAEWSNVPTAIHHQLCAAAGKPDDDPDLLVLGDAISRAWQAFVDQLNGPFNGLDAVRRSATADCLEALLAQYQAQDDGSAASAQLAALLAESDYFAGRLRLVPAAPPSPGCFAVVTDALVAVPFETSKRVGAQSADAFLQGWLAREFHDAATPSGPLQQDVSRFVADLVAHPLPLQIATDFGAAALDDFAKTYNGIAFALRRRDDPAGTSDRWSHASLADFHWPNLHQPRAAGASNATGLQHWLPVAQDGRGPMFRDYEGFPFASKAIARGQADNGPTLERRRLPFFDADVASYAGSGFAGGPMLAYGRTFETFSFATTNAGSLPLALQTADQPWLPKPQFEGPTTVYSAPYQRRTAVGAVTLHSQDGTPWPGAITDVQPLSADYPRHALCATPQAPGVIELMRDADGDGMLAFPPPDLEQGIAARRVDLVDLAWSGGRGDLRIELFRAAAEAGAASSFQFNFAGIDATSLTEPRISIWLETVLVDPLGPDGPSAQRRLRAQLGAGAVQTLDPIAPLDGWWMRLTLTSSAGPVALSFADDSAHHDIDRRDAALMLLHPPVAPNTTTPWTAGASAAAISIETPRVLYFDFERWYANRELQAASLANADAGQQLLMLLLDAYTERHTDTAIQAIIDRLPDPAVQGLLVELVCTDSLGGATPACEAVVIDLGGRLSSIAEELEREHWGRKALLEKIAELFTITAKITTDGPLQLRTDGKLLHASVPPGMVAELRVSPIVAATHFQPRAGHPSVFFEPVRQMARRVRPDGTLVFAPATLRIEVMQDKLPGVERALQLANAMIGCRSAAHVREYALIAAHQAQQDDRNDWRGFGMLEVITQRWRPTGRPIYTYLRPLDHQAKGVGGGLSIVPFHQGSGEIAAVATFEREAFFARKAADAEAIPARIEPLHPMLPGAAAAPLSGTELQKFPWHAASATYFRHRFRLHSRYAGALSVTRRAVNTWGEADDTPAAWSHRVAVLADAGRVALTRPQLRALMPLTTNPDSDRSTTPPVLAYLQEPPFSEGGLADRIGADLKLGFGFGFKSGPQVGILDARKEIGPDPRLSYSAMPADQALAMGLMAEGPIGLTFDDTAVAGPAFANAMVSLAPIRLPTGQPAPDPMPSLEEHFLGVALRRYLDPDWVTPDGPVRLDGSQALWLDYDLGRLSHDAALLSCRIGATEVPLLKLVQTGEAFGIDIATAAADAGGGNAGVDWVTITALPAGATRLALLHQPVAPGRYSVAVFCSVPSQIRAGHSNQPLLLASVEWSPQQAAGAGEMILVAPGATPRPTRASAATFLAWTRTNRDFDRVVVKTAADDRTIAWRNLVARRSTLAPQISLLLSVATGAAAGAAAPAPTPLSAVWLRPSTWATPYPIHVHRHQALLGTRYASGLGRPIEVYAGATLAAAALIELAENGPLRQATNLRLVEFETPAAIICSASSVPPRYRSAYFDLKATGGSWERSIQLYLRFVGSPRYLSGFSQLRLKLGFWQGGEDGTGIPVERAMTLNSLAGVAGAELTIVGGVITLVTLSADGVRIAMESAAVPVSAPDARGFMLDITTPDGPGEFWADVSMLHSRLPQPQPTASADSPLRATDFDFDWLFSASEADPALAVRPVALAQMTEAQARIISISPLIPIEDID